MRFGRQSNIVIIETENGNIWSVDAKIPGKFDRRWLNAGWEAIQNFEKKNF